MPDADVAARLRTYVGAAPGGDLDQFVTDCAAEAEALVAAHVGAAVVPAEVRARAVLEVGSELYHRKAAPNGVASYGLELGGASPVRIARDPMVGAYPLLAAFVGPGIG